MGEYKTDKIYRGEGGRPKRLTQGDGSNKLGNRRNNHEQPRDSAAPQNKPGQQNRNRQGTNIDCTSRMDDEPDDPLSD
jgi:hypothetical protein